MATSSGVDNASGMQRVLSSRVTSMKFMRRKEQSDTRDRVAIHHNKATLKSQWVLLSDAVEAFDSSQQASSDASTAQTFVPSRRSFNSFNPAVESARKACCDTSLEKSSEKGTVSDREMVSRYQNLIGGQQFQKHSLETANSNSKKRKTESKDSPRRFVKPKPL